MTLLSEQLKTIFTEITGTFTRHPQIEITPIAGNPPEQYRITYHVQGLCQQNGEITPCSSHTILISFPFGFPHFPPNCRPESPIFHPDFDQSAICLGEFWDNNHSLTELIFQIGRMISGEVFSTTSAFNEEAATWYKEHPERLPLDTIQAAGASKVVQEATDLTELSIETVETEPLTDFLASPTAGENAPPPNLTQAAPSIFPGFEESTFTKNDKQREEAQKKHQEGEKYEHQGRPGKALELYQDIKDLVPDFPDIDKDISRAEFAVSMLGDWAADDTPPQETKIADKKKKPGPHPVEPKTPDTRKTTDKQIKSTARKVPTTLIATFCLLLLIISAAWLFTDQQMKRAQDLLAECKQFIGSDQFTEADQKCTEALHASSLVWVLLQSQKHQCISEIQQIRNTPSFKEGLALSQTKGAPSLPEWQNILQQSEQFFREEKWKDALEGYTKTLQFASDTTTIDSFILDNIRQKIIITRSHIYVEAGKRALAGADWNNAKYNLTKALELCQQNPLISSPDLIQKINTLLRQVDFNDLMTTGENFYAKGDWSSALSAFEQAQKAEHEAPFADTETLFSLQEIIARSKVFYTLELGKEAFANTRWDQATEHYERAITLLEENREVLRRDDPEKSQQKISRLLLHTAIIKDKQKIAAHLKNQELSLAINTMRSLLSKIDNSEFAKENEFQKIHTETEDSISKSEEELLLKEQSDYLTANYQRLFIQNNPSLRPENLSNPRATFLKKINNQYLFRLQCSEEGHGRPVLLQSSYLFDPTTKKWRFYVNDGSAQQNIEAGKEILSAAYHSQEKRMIEAGKTYLLSHFKSLFNQGNPDLLPENLSQPQVAFLREIHGNLLFSLQCSDSSSGHPALLEGMFLFNPTSKEWTDYSNRSGPQN